MIVGFAAVAILLQLLIAQAADSRSIEPVGLYE